MSKTFARLDRKRGLVLIGLALLAAAVVLGASVLQRDARARRLADEINSHGGDCRRAAPVWQWLQYWAGRANRPMPADVLLVGRYFTPAWLEQNDYLADLRIDRLSIRELTIAGEEIRSISQRHPLRCLGAFRLRHADRAAGGGWQAGEIEEVDLAYSDLTNEGLRQLPLERIRSLSVAGTRVDAAGLQQLACSTKLVEIMLDGNQFDASVVTVLNSLPEFFGIFLEGPSVTDEHIRLLQTMPRVNSVMIESTSATHAALGDFAKAKPDCLLIVDSLDFDPKQ